MYPYPKRVTWLCHVWLGVPAAWRPGRVARSDGERRGRRGRCRRPVPVGGGIRPVLRAPRPRARPAEGLHSWATRWGERGVFSGARGLHAGTFPPAAEGVGLGGTAGTGSVWRLWRGCSSTSIARPTERPASARPGVLHCQRRHQRGVPRARRAGPLRRARDVASRGRASVATRPEHRQDDGTVPAQSPAFLGSASSGTRRVPWGGGRRLDWTFARRRPVAPSEPEHGVIRAQGVEKRFGRKRALRAVSIELRRTASSCSPGRTGPARRRSCGSWRDSACRHGAP